MRINFSKYLFNVVLLLMVLAACKEQEPPEAPPVLPADRSIRVTAHHRYNLSPPMDSTLSGVEVRLYDNRENFEGNFMEEATRTTDSTGVALFEFRKDEYYWIRAIHPLLGEVLDSVSTPGSTVSFVELLFY